MSNTLSTNADSLKVEDVLNAPMPQAHKDIVVWHLKRLKSIVEVPRGEDFIARSMKEHVAQEQLDKMTRVFRSYQERQRRREFSKEDYPDGEVESMMTDLIDGCILSSFTAALWDAPFPRNKAKTPEPSSSKQHPVDVEAEQGGGPHVGVVQVRGAGPGNDSLHFDTAYWRKYFSHEYSRPRSQSDPVRSPSLPKSPTIIRDRPAFTRMLSQETLQAASQVAWGAWPLSPDEEWVWFATGVTAAQGEKETAWNWRDFLR